LGWDHETGGTAHLLGDTVRDLGQVVQIEAQVVRPGPGLCAPVLHDLDVGGLAGGAGRGNGVATGSEHVAGDRHADGLEGSVLARRRDDGPPAARRPRLVERNLGEVSLTATGLVLGADHVKGEVLEGSQPDAVARGLAAVLAVAAVVDRPGSKPEPVAMERAIDDGRNPPRNCDRRLSCFHPTEPSQYYSIRNR
jgi:hypothetical protein